jgi:hypothetical protein
LIGEVLAILKKCPINAGLISSKENMVILGNRVLAGSNVRGEEINTMTGKRQR